MTLLVSIPALLILAAVGAYSIISASVNPWHWLLVAAEFGGLLLLVRLGWVEIGNLRKPSR